jgi:hypothetical protein
MVVRHLALMTAATLLIVACMLLPFLPGGYDGLAVPLSTMAQLFGVVGLLLVPLGAIWLVHELRRRATKAVAPPADRAGFWFDVVTIVALTVVAIVVALGAFASLGISLGLAVLALWAWFAWRLAAKLKAMRNAPASAFNTAPLYLVVLPIVAAIARFTLVDRASGFSRNRAIRNSAGMISDIERYHDAHGHYPRSLLALWQDYRPSVIGVEQYHYEPNGDAYNLYFEQFSPTVGTREIVMYNPRGEHEMTSHDTDLLQRTPAELALRRGYYAARDVATPPHWKRFLFD